MKSGSTAVTVFIQEDTIYIAWVGDSQAILAKDGQALKIMDPHKPERVVSCFIYLYYLIDTANSLIP